MDMNEILANPRAWAVLDASTQISKDRVYVERIWYRVGNVGDQIKLFDGVGTTGKSFPIMHRIKDTTEQLEIGLIFETGLYFEDTSGSGHIIVSYIRLPR